MSEGHDAIIIGAGIIGAAIALELGRKGYRTLNVDKLPAAGYGSTGASCAIIRTHYSTLDGSALAYESYFHWQDWAQYLGVEDERGLAQFHDCGCLVMKTEANGYLAKIRGLMDQLGVPYEDWDAARIQAKFPNFDLRRFYPPRSHDDPEFGTAAPDRLAGGVFFPTAGYISDPQLATHNLQRAAEAAGGEFRFNVRVAEILKSAGRVAGVRLADGTELRAPVVVNVAGPHSYLINEMAGVTEEMTISTRALRQEVVHLPSPAGMDYERAGIVVSDSDIGCYSRPEVGNAILVGSEDPACDKREFVDPDDYNKEFTDLATSLAHRYAQRYPEVGIPSRTKGVVDLYDASDDWIPIYDKSSLGGYYMAIGTSGNQFKNAPVAAKMMAALIDSCEHGRDHDTDPVHLDLPKVGRAINIGFFSRKREVNPDSSFSVLG